MIKGKQLIKLYDGIAMIFIEIIIIFKENKLLHFFIN
jgi:hypothetical protein